MLAGGVLVIVGTSADLLGGGDMGIINPLSISGAIVAVGGLVGTILFAKKAQDNLYKSRDIYNNGLAKKTSMIKKINLFFGCNNYKGQQIPLMGLKMSL